MRGEKGVPCHTCHDTTGVGLPSAEQVKEGVLPSPWERVYVCAEEGSWEEVMFAVGGSGEGGMTEMEGEREGEREEDQ